MYEVIEREPTDAHVCTVPTRSERRRGRIKAVRCGCGKEWHYDRRDGWLGGGPHEK